MKRVAIVLCLAAVLAMPFLFSPGYSEDRESVEVFFSPKGGAEKAIRKAIRAAHHEILVAMYHFTSWELAHALFKAKKRGVKVIVVLDKSQAWGKGSQDEYLAQKGVEVRYMDLPYEKDPQERKKFHHKFAVIDGKTVITGSYNWTKFAESENYENLVIIHSEGLAGRYRAEFKERILPKTIEKEPAEEKED